VPLAVAAMGGAHGLTMPGENVLRAHRASLSAGTRRPYGVLEWRDAALLEAEDKNSGIRRIGIS